MAITKEITRLEKSNVKLSVTVPKDDVRTQYENMLREYMKDLQLPGFRKGKVPKEVLERKFGESLRNEAVGRIVETSLKDIFENNDLGRYEKPLAYSTPELEGEPKLELEQDLQFAVTYDVLPEIKIGQWKGLTVEHQYAEIENDVIEKELNEIRERNAIVMDRDDDAAALKGDVVTVDYEVSDENGEKDEDHNRKNFAFTLGSNSSSLDFDDNIVGMKKGETKEFYKKFDDDYHEPHFAGKNCKIQITLNELKEKKLPELDDELAQDVDEKYNTLEDLKNSIYERQNKNLQKRLHDIKLNELLKKIMENSPVILPESLIQAELESRWRRLAHYYRMDTDALKELMASDPENIEKEKERRETAEKVLHSRMIIETLMEEQNIQISDEDLEKEYEQMARDDLKLQDKDISDELSAGDLKNKIEEIKNSLKEQDIFYLKEQIKEQRTTDIMLAENTFNPGKKENYLDLMSDNS